MRFSKGELEILKEIADGNRNVKNIALALKKSRVQVYRTGQKLIEKGFIDLSDGTYALVKSTTASLLGQLLGDFPSLIASLSDCGVDLLLSLLEPKSIHEILQESRINRTQIFKKIKQARSISLVRKIDEKYILNEKLWPRAIEVLKEIKKYQEFTDARIPSTSTIYYKNEKEILFSNKENVNATLTAFSVYDLYGIKILPLKNYYYLPKKRLSKKEVFLHSLYIAEKEYEAKYIIFIALFYCKYKKYLRRIKHIILDNIKKIFEGKQISGYPNLEEIRERAEVYDIKI